MLLQLGQRSLPQDVVDALYECHLRIRKFLELGRRLAATSGLPAREVADAAGQIHRYFSVAFPLHIADEDTDITPRLAGQGADVDAALAQMRADHVDHAALIARYVALCAELVAEPALHAARQAVLGEVVAALIAELEPHLALEERTIFPALRALPEPVRGSLHAAMRARRDQVLSPG